jgi:hypothetical protein
LKPGVLSIEEPVPIEMVGIRDHFCGKGICSSIRKVLKKYK